MADIIKITEAFAEFLRPKTVTVHGGIADAHSFDCDYDAQCFDCVHAEDRFQNQDCASLLRGDTINLRQHPLDCLNADAFIHFFPAIVKQSFGPDGQSIAETVAWILGAEEWDTDLTMTQQIRHKLNSAQCHLVREYLNDLAKLPLSAYASEHLDMARRNWTDSD